MLFDEEQKYIKFGYSIYPIEGSLQETLKKHRYKLRTTLGAFSIVTLRYVNMKGEPSEQAALARNLIFYKSR